MANFIEPSLLIPPLRLDQNLRALESLSAPLRALPFEILIIYDFDNVSASALPHLAEQFQVQGDAGWNLATTEQQKRDLLKEAIALHKKRGTRYAVEHALEKLGIICDLEEWFESQPIADPYTFKVKIDTQKQPPGAPIIDGKRMAKIMNAIWFWKNVRSHFRVELNIYGESFLKIGAVFSMQVLWQSQSTPLPPEFLAASTLLTGSVASIMLIWQNQSTPSQPTFATRAPELKQCNFFSNTLIFNTHSTP